MKGNREDQRMDLDTGKGLYRKFNVSRTDGSSRKGRKHHACEFFVLDLDHDEHAVAALKAYARSCRKEYPQLAADLQDKIFRLTRAPR